MNDDRSLLQIVVRNPAAQGLDYETEAILFLSVEPPSPNTLNVTLTNISGSSLVVHPGARISWDFAGLLGGCDLPAGDLLAPGEDWSARTAGTVVTLVYNRPDSLEWKNGERLEFLLEGDIMGELEKARSATWGMAVDGIDGLQNGMGQWQQYVLMARPRQPLPDTVKAEIETRVLYTKPADFSNELKCYLENTGDEDIQGGWTEISLAYGDQSADLIEPGGRLPILAVTEMASNTPWGTTLQPRLLGDELTWQVFKSPPLPKHTRLCFTFTKLMTDANGSTTVTIRLKGMNDYQPKEFPLRVQKEDAPALRIVFFKGAIVHVNGKPQLRSTWLAQDAAYCTLDQDPRQRGTSCPDASPDFQPVGPLEQKLYTHTLTAFAEQQNLQVRQAADMTVLPPELHDVAITDHDHFKGKLQVNWRSENAEWVHLKLTKNWFLGKPETLLDQSVELRGLQWFDLSPWGMAQFEVCITAGNPGGETQQSNSWTG
jgi:hypothetical protein